MTVKNDIYTMVSGTCYQGTIKATYAELADLGLLTDLGPQDKSTCEFVGMVGGQVVTIYDWKNEDDIYPHQSYIWNVGGKNRYSVLFLEDAMTNRYGKPFDITVNAIK